jgi:glycine dehydrogenase subunit 1
MQFVPTTEKEKQELLSAIGVRRFEDLIPNIPKQGLFAPAKGGMLKNGLSEMEVQAHLQTLAGKNKTVEQYASFLGAGAYHHFIPAAVGALITRGEFLTAYTPYQPEASQGTLQATFEFQSMVAGLYGMDVANASLYDGGSALAEAALLAVRETGRRKILVSRTVHPEYHETLNTYSKSFEVQEVPADAAGVTSMAELEKRMDGAACVIIQTPNFFGCLEDGAKIAELAHKHGALLVVSADPLSLGMLTPPGDYGADVATGEGQPLGIPLHYGGPYLGLFACKEKFLRKVPGRICGMTKDANGKRGFTLTLQTREQHIRREKATSNICTNEALMALAATVYLSLLGPQGLKDCAQLNFDKAHYAADRIGKIPGFKLAFAAPFFNEFAVKSKLSPQKINQYLLTQGILGGLPLGKFYPELSDAVLYCVTEMNSREQIDRLAGALETLARQEKLS